MLLGALAALATGMVIAGSGNLSASFEGVDSERALWAARAGTALGLVKLKDDSNWPGFGSPQSLSGTDHTFEVTTYRNPQQAPRGGVVPVGLVYLHAIGRTRSGKVREMGTLTTTSFGAMSYAVLAKDSMLLDNAQVDVRDPATNLVIPGFSDLALSSPAGSMTLSGSTITGNLDMPTLATLTNTSAVSGIRRVFTSLTYPDVVLPAGADPESAPDMTFSSGTHALPPGVYKTVTIDNGATVNFSPGEYSVKELIVKNNSTLKYADLTQRCDIFATTKVEMENYNIVNDSKKPANFRILAEETAAPPVNMKLGTTGYFVLYAPNSDMLVDDNVEIYGSVVAKNAVVKNNSKVHYDPASAGALNMGGGTATGVSIVSQQYF